MKYDHKSYTGAVAKYLVHDTKMEIEKYKFN